MTGETNTFKIEHGPEGSKQTTEFELAQLPALDSLGLADEVFGMMPAYAVLKKAQEEAKATTDPKAVAALNAGAIVAMSRMTKHVLKFAPHFQRVCKAKRTGLANVLVPLTADVTFNDFFGRNQSLLIQWVLRCVEYEFASFLEEESSRNQSSAGATPAPST